MGCSFDRALSVPDSQDKHDKDLYQRQLAEDYANARYTQLDDAARARAAGAEERRRKNVEYNAHDPWEKDNPARKPDHKLRGTVSQQCAKPR